MTEILWIIACAAMLLGLLGVFLPLLPGIPLLFGGMLAIAVAMLAVFAFSWFA